MQKFLNVVIHASISVLYFGMTTASAGEDEAPKVTVQVVNTERKGIEGAMVKQGYASSKYSPVYTTDQFGKAQVNAIYYGMSVKVGEIMIATRYPSIVEPYVFVVPTKKVKLVNGNGIEAGPVENNGSGKQFNLRVLEFAGEPLSNILVQVEGDKNELKKYLTDKDGRVEVVGQLGPDTTIRVERPDLAVEFIFKVSAVAWPCEIVFPKFKKKN